MFADLNKHAINTTKSIGILYDSRDEMAKVTKEVIDNVPLLAKFTDRENSSISKYSAKLFTLSSVYDTNYQLIRKRKNITKKDISLMIAFWKTLSESIVEWKQVQEKELSASNLRLSYIHTHGVVLEAFGMLGHYLIINREKGWISYIAALDKLDWSRSNLADWGGRVIRNNGNISKSRTNVLLTYIKIKKQLNLSLTPEEDEEEEKFIRGGQ